MDYFFETVTIGKLPLYSAFQNIEVSTVALLFNLLLLMIVEAQRIRQRQGRNEFSFVVSAVMVANMVTCLYVFLAYVDMNVPNTVICSLQALAFLFNSVICYYFAAHVVHFVNRLANMKIKIPLFNKALLVVQAVILTVWLSFAIPYIQNTGTLIRPSGPFYILIGFLMEVYHMFFALALIVKHRDLLGIRAQLTVLSTFFMTIATIVLQAYMGRAPVINYLGATFGLFVFYFNAETPDYIALTKTLEELKVERRKAEAANRAKSEFLANMSHEMRTPLSAVLGMNEMIIRESEDGEITEYARSVERAGQSLLAVINDVLDFSKIESGKLSIVDAPYSLSNVIADIYIMMAFKAERGRLEFRTNVDAGIPDMLKGDEIRIRQVMTNLLNNAIKYTREGSVDLSVRRDPDYYSEDGEKVGIVITVTDTGIGIKPEDMEKLFGKFERFDMEVNNSVEGAGLGLAITHEIVTMMGGTIKAESSYGEGSVFEVRIPQEIYDKAPIGDFKKTLERRRANREEYHVSFNAPDANILVVDDTDINLTVFRKLLSQTRIMTDTAAGGLEALSLTQDIPYDIIFMDQRMPGMDGEKTLSHIRTQAGGVNKDTPVVCLTADAVSGAKEKYLSMGFTDYLQKPIDAAKLEAMVMHYLPPEKVLKADGYVYTDVASGDGAEDDAQGAPDEKTLRSFFDKSGVLSFRSAIRNCADAETLFVILKEYYNNIPENIELLQRFADRGDTENYTIKVHGLKSASRMIGALDFAENAYLMEQVGERADADAVREKTPALINEYLAIKDVLGPLMQGGF